MRKQDRWRRATFYLGPLIAWSLVISDLSTQQGRTDNSAYVVRWLLNALSPAFARSLDNFQFFCLHYASRKTAHVTEYLVLGLLAVRAAQWGRRGFRWKSALAGIAVPAVFSALDELHQAFVPGRTSSGWDVLIDISGATIGVACICLGAVNRWMEERMLRRSPAEITEEELKR
jgi:VanZ family protein